MLSEINGLEVICIYAGKSDLCKKIDSLATLEEEQFNLSPFQLMVFAGPDQTNSKGCSGKAMDSDLSTSV